MKNFKILENTKLNFQIKISLKKALKKNRKLSKNYNWKFKILKNSLKIKNLKKFTFKELTIDSKKIKKNSLFVAIKGKK